MAVYHGDNPIDFVTAVNSIYHHQTLKPSEIVLVVDGPVPKEMDNAIVCLQNSIDCMKVVRFAENRGHAATRQAGLEAASNELIAIMDADDISESIRFEKQLQAFKLNPEVSIIGGQIKEFVGDQHNTVGERIVPIDNTDIKSYLKSRCPMNLVTVMYRKTDVIAVGGFENWYCEEDYFLWIRLAEAGYMFANLPDTLVNVRVGKDMYKRRGGWKYFKSEAKLQSYMLKHGIISLPRYCYNVAGRFVIQVAMPNSLRGIIFQKLFRK